MENHRSSEAINDVIKRPSEVPVENHRSSEAINDVIKRPSEVPVENHRSTSADCATEIDSPAVCSMAISMAIRMTLRRRSGGTRMALGWHSDGTMVVIEKQSEAIERNQARSPPMPKMKRPRSMSSREPMEQPAAKSAWRDQEA